MVASAALEKNSSGSRYWFSTAISVVLDRAKLAMRA